ncbi:MAG: D-glycero-beta-D-manno-heptose 1-phosphate adenylyltransferase [Thermodesulfobacteriota bacterium]
MRAIKKITADLKAQGKRIVFTNGCFDLLHVGHVRYLQKAKKLGDVLIIGLNTDHSVKLIKGNNRPIIPQKERAEVLSALVFVDYVVFFNEPDPLKIIKAIQPDILVKGADWDKNKIVGREIVEGAGGKVVRISLVPGASSTKIIEKIIKIYRLPKNKSSSRRILEAHHEKSLRP